jgi:hypothetical protein
MQPSAQPSRQPSNQPSSVPTPIPSQFINRTEWQVRLHDEVRNATIDLDTGVTQLLYSELTFSYKFDHGGCQAWTDYLKSVEMKTALTVQKVTSITISTVKLMYDYYQEHDSTPETFTCTDPALAHQLVERLAYSNVENTNVSVNCNGTNWQIRNCIPNSPSICLNCVDPCTVHCSNARDVNFVASCVVEAEGSCVDRFGRRSGLKNNINVLTVTAVERVPAPNIVSMRVVNGTNEADVTVVLDNAGGVYCAAFSPPLSALPSTLDEIRASRLISYAATPTNSTYSVTVNIPDLVAATTYKLYCFSFSPSGAQMSWNKLKAQGVRTLQTACCKTVTASLSTTVLSTSPGSYKSFLSIKLNAAPSADLNVAVRTVPDSAVQALFPQTITVPAYAAANKLQHSIALDAAKLGSGSFYVQLTLSGTASAEYAAIFAGNASSFVVLAPGATPPPPQLFSAVFSSLGDSVTVVFDSPTNRGGVGGTVKSFLCRDLLLFKTSNYSKCSWVDDTTLLIAVTSKTAVTSVVGIAAYNSLASQSTATSLVVGDVLSLVSGKIAAKCVSNPCPATAYTSSSAVRISAPEGAPAPRLLISAPLIVSKCDDFTLDLTSSSNFGGGLFLNFAVTVQSGTASPTSVAAVQTFLQSSYVLNPPTPVPASLLEKAVQYTFVVRGCNKLARCSSVFHSVSIANATNPLVAIEGSPVRTLYRYQPVLLNAQAYMRNRCSDPPTKRNLQYTWQVRYKNLVKTELVSVSNNPAVFLLPAYSLNVGSNYVVYVTALDVSSGYSATTSVTVTIQSGDLIARIAGPNVRTVSVGSTLALAATSSYDENDARTGLQKSFQYTWTCAQQAPNVSDHCAARLFTVAGLTSGYLTVTPLVSNVTAVFSVVVAENSANNRSSTAIVTVTSVPATTSNFSLSIAPVNSNLNPTFKQVSRGLVISPDEKLKLLGTIRIAQPGALADASLGSVSATWQVNDTSVDLSSSRSGAVLMTKLSLDLLPIAAAATAQTGGAISVPFNFALKSNALQGGRTYLFMLTVRTSTASIVVTVNAPPTPGMLTVTPQYGTELTTDFTLLATQWLDSDLPLSYKFAYITSAGNPVPLSTQSERTYMVTTLPCLRRSESYVPITIAVTVVDAYQSSSNTTATAFTRTDVTNPVIGAKLLDLLLTSLNTSTGDDRKTHQLIGVFGAVLNSVNCSLSPNCSTLHREECSSVTNACGPCVANYTGIHGPSNTMCVSMHTLRSTRRLLGTDDQSAAVASNCTLDDDCQNPFALCMGGKCIVPRKSCPTSVAGAECSGHGDCVFVNSASNKQVRDCALDDLYCEAKCVCRYFSPEDSSGGDNQTHYGAACEVPEDIYVSNARTRLVLLQALTNTTRLRDASAEVIASWADTLAALTQVPAELGAAAVDEMLGLFHLTMYSAETVEASEQNFAAALRAIDSLAALVAEAKDFDAYNLGLVKAQTSSKLLLPYSDTLLSRVETALQTYAATLSYDMLYGQNAVDSVLSEVRMSVQVLPMYTTHSAAYSTSSSDEPDLEQDYIKHYKRSYYLVDQSNQLALPLNDLERFLDRRADTVTVPALYSANADDAVTAVVYSLKNKLFTNAVRELYEQGSGAAYSNVTLQSNPVKLVLSSITGRDLSLNCTSRTAQKGVHVGTRHDGDLGCEMTVVLQHSVYAPYIEPWENMTYTTCYDQDYMVYDYPCLTAPGTNLTVTCPLEGGVVVNRCPIYNLTSVCNTLVNNSNAYSGGYGGEGYGGKFNFSSCYVESFTPYNVSCTCRIEEDALLYSDSSSGEIPFGEEFDFEDVRPYAHLSEDRRRALRSRMLSAQPAHSAKMHKYANFTTLTAMYVAQPRVYQDVYQLEFRPSPYYRHTYTSYIVDTAMVSFAIVAVLVTVASYSNDQHLQKVAADKKLKEYHEHELLMSKKRVKFDKHVIIMPESKTSVAAEVWTAKPTRKVADRNTLKALKGEIGAALAHKQEVQHEKKAVKKRKLELAVIDRPKPSDVALFTGDEGGETKHDPEASPPAVPELALALVPTSPSSQAGRKEDRPGRLVHSVSGLVAASPRQPPKKLKRDRVIFSKWADLPTAASHRADRELVDVLNAVPVDFTLPRIYAMRAVGFLTTFCAELAVYHRWLTVIVHFSVQYSRIYRLIALMYQALTPLFLIAVMFTYLNRDNGYCKSITNQRDCIVVKSDVVAGYDMCNWYTNSQTCGFRQPQQSMMTIFAVTFIAAVISVPIARFVEYLLIRVAVSSNSAAAADTTNITSETVSILKKPKPGVEDELALTGTVEDSADPQAQEFKTVKEYLHHHLFVVPLSTRVAQLYVLSCEVASALCGSKRRAKIYADVSAAAEAAALELSPANMAQNKGHLIKVDEVMEMYRNLDPDLYKRYPILLYVRRVMHLSVPLGLQPVDFVDAVPVGDEVSELCERFKQYTADMTKDNNLEELERVLGTNVIYCEVF